MKKVLFVFVVAPFVWLSWAGLPQPCDPTPVKKPVKVVRREIKVSIIGADRPAGPADVSQATAENCFAYWKRWMDKEIDKYGDRFEMRNPGAVGAVTVLSHDPTLPIDNIVREFGLILWDDYYARSVRLRGGELKMDRNP